MHFFRSQSGISQKQLYAQEYAALSRLGVPIVVGQIGMTIQGLADTIMVGRHSTEELAAAGFVNSLFILAILLSMGYSMGAVSRIGSCYACGQSCRVVGILKGSLVADLAQCLLLVGIMSVAYVFLPQMGQPVELLPLMRPYYLISLASLPAVAAGWALRQFFDTIGDTSVGMWITIVGNVWNIVFNYLWIFGRGGFPEMGIAGAAWATLTSRLVMLALYVAVFVFHSKYGEYRSHWHAVRITRTEVALLNRLGWPIALQMGFEHASFSACGIMLGWVGTAALAAHQVMQNVSMLVFLFYVGIGSAVAIRVSHYKGVDDYGGVRRAAHAGYHLILIVGIVACGIVFALRHDISELFTDSTEVAVIVAILVWPMALYQIGDGLQTCYVNALRGLGDVRPLILYAFIAYVIVSIPLSYLFGIVMDGGALGIWMGLPFGLTTAGVLYYRRFRRVCARHDVSTRPHTL